MFYYRLGKEASCSKSLQNHQCYSADQANSRKKRNNNYHVTEPISVLRRSCYFNWEGIWRQCWKARQWRACPAMISFLDLLAWTLSDFFWCQPSFFSFAPSYIRHDNVLLYFSHLQDTAIWPRVTSGSPEYILFLASMDIEFMVTKCDNRPTGWK